MFASNQIICYLLEMPSNLKLQIRKLNKGLFPTQHVKKMYANFFNFAFPGLYLWQQLYHLIYKVIDHYNAACQW